MSKRSEAVQNELEQIRLQMKRVDSMLILAQRVTAESAVDTVRLNWLENEAAGQQVLSFVGDLGNRSTLLHGTLRETIDQFIEGKETE